MTDIASFEDIAIGATNRGLQPEPFFPPSPIWRWYAGAVAVGIASAMAAALGLNALTTPKPIVAAAVQQETIAIKTDRVVRTIPIVPTPVIAPSIAQTPSVAEPAHPSTLERVRLRPVRAGDSGSNQGKQEGPAADPHLQGRSAPQQDICARHGGHRENYERGSGWRGWRCVFPKKGR